MYTQRHYIDFAELIRKLPAEITKAELTDYLSSHFAADNSRFKRSLFEKAAGREKSA